MAQKKSLGRSGVKRAESKIGWRLAFSASALGATSVITQVVLLREFLSAFYGNELVMGVILANWMALTGAGSFVGKFSDRLKNKESLMAASLVLLGALSAVTVFLLDYLRNIVFTAGSMPGIVQILFSSFVLLAPFCLLSGFSFAFFSNTVSEKYGSNLITNVYSLEAAGSMAGGFIFSLLMIHFLKTFQSLALLMAFNVAAAHIVSAEAGRKLWRYTVLFVAAVLLPLFFFFSIDDIARGYLFRGQEVLFYKDTPYGNLTVTERGGQRNFFENNVLLFSTEDIELNEESVHYAMLQHPAPETVLLISGGISGATDEILKYDSVRRIDYVEINPTLIDIGRRYASALSDSKIRVVNEDARLFIKKTSGLYDVVLINLPDPGTAQINRFYTAEFFRDLKKRLNGGAVVSLGLLSSVDYWGGEAVQIFSVMHKTLGRSFKNVVIVPGTKTYFVASDAAVGINIAELVDKRGVETLYVNGYYIDDGLLAERSGDITGKLDGAAPLNTDFSPVSYYRQLRYWLSYFRLDYRVLAAAAIALLLFSAFRLNVVSFGMFTGGFAAASIEVLLLIAFQVIYGYVYLVTGIIITVFMAGMAAGSFYRQKVFSRADMKNYRTVQLSVGAYAALLPLLLFILKGAAGHVFIIHAIFFLLTFGIAFLVGMEFSIASKLREGSVSTVASEIYGIDLMGSAAGALLMATYLIPLLGMARACYVVAALSFTSGAVSYLKRAG